MKVAASSRVEADTMLSPPMSALSAPRKQATTGLPQSLREATIFSITLAAGGLETMPITSERGSFFRASRASSIILPPTASLTSLPPVPRAWEMPPPSRSIITVTSCSPVPAAATMPILPWRTMLAKPRATPFMMAVPQSGPIISRLCSTA